MKIIIVGCGKVGYAIAQQLTQEKHDITVVDDEAAHLNRADSTLDVLCIHGNGASISVLMEAGARDADLVIAVTGVDETNLVCALIAKSVGAQHTIARVRNPEYRRDADMLKREIGLEWSSIPTWPRRRRSHGSSASRQPSPWSPLPAGAST